MPPAARVGDPVSHAPPPVLGGVLLNFTVIIGGKPAWRGVSPAVASSIQSAWQATDATIKAADAAANAATGTPAYPGLKAAAEAAKVAGLAAMSATITSAAAGADIHICSQPLPPVPHGPGVVVNPSKTVFISGMAAARQGDTIVEAVGPADKIALGMPTVNIGG